MPTTILIPEAVLPRPESASLRIGAAIAVENSTIAAIDTPGRLRLRWPASTTLELPGCLIMPGLINAHQHGRGLSQIQLGYHDDFLEPWISNRRGRGLLDPYAITKLAAVRMLANGVTSAVHANYSYGTGDYESELRAQLRAYDEAGLRVTMCVGAMDRGTVVYPPHEACFLAGLPDDLKTWLSRPGAPAYAGDAAATIALMERLLADFRDHPRVRLCYGPAGPQWVSEELWSALGRDAAAKGIGIHLHALESPAQRDAAAELFPEGVLAWLERLGIMTPRTVIAHGVWVSDADMALMARTGVTVVRNPGCNLRMRNGIAPLARYLAHGVRVAIGSDNASLSDDEDLLSELRLAGQLAREPDWNGPAPPDCDQLLAMLTVNGAVAAQFAAQTGTLEPGKAADLVAVSLARTRHPLLDADMPLLEALLARARGSDVRLTMVDGRILYDRGNFPHLDLSQVEQAAVRSARNARRPGDPRAYHRAAGLSVQLHRHYSCVAARHGRSNQSENPD
ncbi:MAG TPA: amidohydrolase family protein [Xanthobacteraceae bacterium]|jgi:cytosine/adenosine deaminase-related metal-dependent hydrolase